ncbi:hypothetical protein JST97_32525 [bacterium]|nr:hypothetical protein [bacterium]
MNDELPNIPPDECYAQMGFKPFEGGPHVEASDWRRVQNSKLLKDMHQRYVWLRDLAGKPLVDNGYVVGWIPPLRLGEEEFGKLMTAIEKGLAMGCTTVQDWQTRKISTN